MPTKACVMARRDTNPPSTRGPRPVREGLAWVLAVVTAACEGGGGVPRPLSPLEEAAPQRRTGRRIAQPTLAKVGAFLDDALALNALSETTALRRATFAIRFRPGGVIEEASLARSSGDSELDGRLVEGLRELSERHTRVDTLTADECAALAGQTVHVVLRPEADVQEMVSREAWPEEERDG